MKRLLLVGWDAADWKVISPLMAEGLMPNVLGLIERGVKGNMATMYPMLSPMLWTTIATGKRPIDHGIHGFSEPDPSGRGIRPITNLSRKVQAIWNIATLMGMRSNVVGWWPSHPAEPIDGVTVSDFFAKVTVAHGEPWPVREHSVHPWSLAERLGGLRVHPQDLPAELIQLFVPKLAEMDQSKERRLWMMAREIAECTAICNVTEALMHNAPWDLTCAYFASIDHFSHGFMNFHPPKMDWVQEKDFEYYQEVVRGGYIYHDILLGRLLRQTDEDTTVILLSDHGFHSDHLRPKDLPHEPAGPAEQHRHYGIFVAAGPGIKRDELVFGATLMNVCPTALTCLDLPVGEDMEGGPLTAIFEDPSRIRYIESWENVEGIDGMHARDTVLDPRDAHESLQQLVELGYIDAPGDDTQVAIDNCVRELRYNLARSHMEGMLHIEAVPILQELHERWPNEFRFGILLIICYLALDRAAEADAIIDAVIANKRNDMKAAREEFKAYREEIKEKLEKSAAGDPEALTEKERHKLRHLRARVRRNPMAAGYLKGIVAAGQRQYGEALKHLSVALKASPDDLRVLLKLGDVQLAMKQKAKARKSFLRATELDPENAQAWVGIARTCVAQGGTHAQEAVVAARRAIGLIYHNPTAHYLLGLAHLRAGDPLGAEASLKTALAQNNNFPEACTALARIYATRLNEPEKALAMRRAAAQARKRVKALRAELGAGLPPEGAIETMPMPENGEPKFLHDPADTVVVVSGLPRSGTSMMMQMLAAGGVPILTDHTRAADEDNPRGYFELEGVKNIAGDNAWLEEARGRAVKIVANLLPAVRTGLRYKVIFMWRNMEEVLLSQEAMVQRSGHKGGRNRQALARSFNRQLLRVVAAARKNPYMDVLFVGYAEAIHAPEDHARQVNAFLGGAFDEKRMASAIAPELRRKVIEPLA